MEHISIRRVCDHPDCDENGPIAAEVLITRTKAAQRSNPITVDLCDEHYAQLRELFRAMSPKPTSSGRRRRPRNNSGEEA